MNLFLQKYRTFLTVFLLILLALFFRLFYLDRIPTGISDDELNFVLNAKSVFLTGKDIAGIWSPWSLTPITGQFPQAELPYLIMAPFIGPLPLSLFYSKLPYVAVSILTLILLYTITARLIGKTQALFVGIVVAINPWFIFFGRTAYEAPLALFFYLLGFYLLLSLKRWWILLSFIPFFFGFYSYMGTKLIFLPFILITVFYVWRIQNKKKFTKPYLALLSLCVILFAFFLVRLPSSSTTARFSELSTINNPSVINTVNQERRLSLETPLTFVFSNKVVLWGKESILKYFTVFSPELFFATGEARSTFSLWYHGYFYYIDILFLLMGIFWLLTHNKRVFFLLLALIIIAPIPTIASTSGTGFVALRSVLLFPLFCIFVGLGIYATIMLFSKRYRMAAGTLIGVMYLLFIGNFFYVYFFRYPVYSSEAYGFGYRLVSEYVKRAEEKGQKVTIIANGPKSYFYHYIFDTNSYNPHDLKSALNLQTPTINNVTFAQCSSDLTIPQENIVLVKDGEVCDVTIKSKTTSNIPLLADGGAIFSIFNDSICKKYMQKRYPKGLTLSDLDLKNLSEQKFCENFITKFQ